MKNLEEYKILVYFRVEIYNQDDKWTITISMHIIPHSLHVTYFQTFIVFAVPIYSPWDEDILNNQRAQSSSLEYASILHGIAESENSSVSFYDEFSNENNEERSHQQPQNTVSLYSNYANSGYQSIRSTSSRRTSSSINSHFVGISPNQRQLTSSSIGTAPSTPISLNGTKSFVNDIHVQSHRSTQVNDEAVLNEHVEMPPSDRNQQSSDVLNTSPNKIDENNVIHYQLIDNSSKVEVVHDHDCEERRHKQGLTKTQEGESKGSGVELIYGIQPVDIDNICEEQLFSCPVENSCDVDISGESRLFSEDVNGAVGGVISHIVQESAFGKYHSGSKRVESKLEEYENFPQLCGSLGSTTDVQFGASADRVMMTDGQQNFKSDESHFPYSRPPEPLQDDRLDNRIDTMIRCLIKKGYNRTLIMKAVEHLIANKGCEDFKLSEIEAVILQFEDD